jgi:16S rRNA pseudouridine516 synthase
MMQLQDILYSQGFGIRRVCSGLVQQGWVEIWDSEQQAFVPVRDSMLELEPVGLRFRVQGVEWPIKPISWR